MRQPGECDEKASSGVVRLTGKNFRLKIFYGSPEWLAYWNCVPIGKKFFGDCLCLASKDHFDR